MSRLSESEFVRGYVHAMMELSCGPDAEPDMHDGDVSDLADETVAEINDDCANFQKQAAELLSQAYGETSYTESNAGHDFWLTRNHHGAGFWDRDALNWFGPDSKTKLGDALTDLAHKFGETNLYCGDDGKLYLGG